MLSVIVDKIVLKFHFVGSNVPAILQSDYVDLTDGEEVLGSNFNYSKRKYYLRYTNYDQEKFSWEMNGAEIDTCGYFIYYTNNNSTNYYIKINIPIYNNPLDERNYKNKNNAIDDLEITYSNVLNELVVSNGAYLTGNGKIEKQIGACAD